jgi:hypothetical protein
MYEQLAAVRPNAEAPTGRPDAPTSSPAAPDLSRPKAPEEATLTATDHALAIAVLTGKIAAVVISVWLVLGAAAFLLMPRGGSDPCDSMRLSCSAPAP